MRFYLFTFRRGGKKLSEPLGTLREETKVAINYEWAQVAVAKEFEPYQSKTKSKNKAKLTSEMLETIKENMSKNKTFGFRCL